LEFGDGLAAEADAFFRVEEGRFPNHALDTTRATKALLNSDFAQGLYKQAEGGRGGWGISN
jgi:hypothetical protein